MSDYLEIAKSYLILGAGTFGAATALALKKACPGVQILLLDRTPFPCPLGAGHDVNKIIRADYTSPLYMKLALEALDAWRDDPLYSQHFHQTGMLYSSDVATCNEVIGTYEALLGKGNAICKLIDPADARERFNGVFRDANWESVTQCMWSPGAGWADSAGALKSVIQQAVDLGVEYIEATVLKVLFDDQGSCTGAETEDGRRLGADCTILAAGANINLILAESAPERPEIHAGDRLLAVGTAMCTFRIQDDELYKFRDCPMNEVMGKFINSSIPPGENRLLKILHDIGISNDVYNDKIKQHISIPPSRLDHVTWSQNIPDILKYELKAAQKKLYGDWIHGVEPESYRLCWDSFTPNQDWLIGPHPEAKNLYIVGGGSFHAFKFLPIIGDYVVQMLEGRLQEETARRWNWNDPRGGPMICPEYVPDRDLNDLL